MASRIKAILDVGAAAHSRSGATQSHGDQHTGERTRRRSTSLATWHYTLQAPPPPETAPSQDPIQSPALNGDSRAFESHLK